MDSYNEQNVNDINKSLKRFGTADYVIFIIMLMMCSAVGIYFGYADHKKQNQKKSKARRDSVALDYLVGGRNMQTFPVAMSLVASGLSGITLLGMLEIASPKKDFQLNLNLRNANRGLHLRHQHRLYVSQRCLIGSVCSSCHHPDLLRSSNSFNIRSKYLFCNC